MIIAIGKNELLRCLSVMMANRQIVSEFHEIFGTGGMTHTLEPRADVAYGVVDDRIAGLMETALASDKEIFHIEVGDNIMPILANGDFLDVT